MGRSLGRIVYENLTECFLLLAVLFVAAIQLQLQFVQKINWDEFYYLSLIYDYQRGDLSKPMQTLHVHLFGWMTRLGGNEVEKIEIARAVMWCFEIGSLFIAYLISRDFCSVRASLLGVLCFLCAGYVLYHGTSFRADPIAVFFVMVSLYVLVLTKLSWVWIVVMAISMAIAIHVTVKVVLFLPLLIWLGVWQIPQYNKPIEPITRLFLSGLLSILLVYFLYRLQLSLMSGVGANYAKSVVVSAPKTVIADSGLFPRFYFIKESFFYSLPQTVLLMLGVILCVKVFVRFPEKRATVLIIGGFLLPLLSLIFYRNAFPYFFPFIFFPCICMLSFAMQIFEHNPKILVVVVMFLMGNALIHYSKRLSEDQRNQLDVIATVHELFPEGVNYIDRCSMIGSSRKYGFFMSSWGYMAYKKNSLPVLRKAILDNVVPLVIANDSKLNHALRNGGSLKNGTLLYDDGEILKNSYIHHWGPIWLAGAKISLSGGVTEKHYNYVPGVYSIHSRYPVYIDGHKYSNSDTVTLHRGEVLVESKKTQSLTFRWGKNQQETKLPFDGHVFTAF